jgi:23S rRNA (guanosine2251-2'-O)-methyltransferase
MSKRKKTPIRTDRGDKKAHRRPSKGSRIDESAAPKSGPPLLYGKHAVFAALANPRRRIQRLLLTQEARDSQQDDIAEALDKGEHGTIEIISLKKSALEEHLPPGAVHQGMALEASPPETLHIEDIIDRCENDAKATIVILDQATDPHNIGAILRSAAAFGAAAVVVQDRNAPDITGTMAKAASGALERVALVRTTNLARAMEKAKAAGFWCIGLDGQATQTLAEVDLSGRVALVLGAEGSGLRRLTRENCDLLVKVPMTGAVESLNLSNAAAIALYEKARS